MAFNYSPKIITTGLVLYLDAANPKSYPRSGTAWFDLSGNKNDFTFSSTPTMADGVFNSGGTTYAYRNALPINSATNGYTLEAFFKINSSTGGSWQNITQNGGSPNRHMMWYNGGTNTFQALFHEPNTYNNISDSLNIGVWYYLQLSYSPFGGGNNGRRAWINGIEKTVNNTAIGNVTPSGFFTISVDSDLSSNKSNMSYSIIKYYSRGLTSSEILQNYNALKSRFNLG